MPKREGIMRLVGLSSRNRSLMLDQLKRLYNWDFLRSLGDDQIIDLFEKEIDLPGLSHIKTEDPKPKPNVVPFPTDAITPWWIPRPKPNESEDT